ncbi:MAG: nuclear transport factor 2 family protein [Phycisphaerales bacterium JB039]
MTIEQRVHDLVENIKAGNILDAFEKHYAPNCVMQENRNPPFVGKDVNRDREKQFLASVKEWKSTNVRAVAVDDDGRAGDSGTSMIEIDFEFINTDGKPVRYEQVARQQWANGQIVHERFYYDTGA